jgi:hypothetical protein
MDIRDMQGELNRQRLREREMREQQEAKDRAARKAVVGTEMDLVAQDLQDQRFDNMKAKGMMPVPGKIENQPSGILPGEEQVTTMDSLGMASPGVRSGLERQWKSAGSAGTFEQFLQNKYQMMPPEERVQAMRRDGLADQMANQRDRQLARKIVARDARFTPQGEGMNPEQREALLRDTVDAAPTLSELQKAQQVQFGMQEASRMERLRDRLKNQAMTSAMYDPRMAPGMYARSIGEAGNDPMAMARAFAGFGNDQMAERAMGLAAAQMGADAQVAAAREGRDAPDPAAPTLGVQLQKELQDVIDLPPGSREVAMATLLRKSEMPEEDIADATSSILLSHDARTNPARSQLVQDQLRKLASTGTRQQFIAWVLQNMPGQTQQQAEQMYSQAYRQNTVLGTVLGGLSDMFQ